MQPGKTPYHYCSNNPVSRTDPTGMIDGDFINSQGQNIGNDGKNDGKVYVVKTTQQKVDSGAPMAGISQDQQNKTVDFIQNNSGNSAAFEGNSMAYDNSVEIAGSCETRESMVNIVNQDTGSGGNSVSNPMNAQEYGGAVQSNGSVRESTERNKPFSINSMANNDSNTVSNFHSHPSALLVIDGGAGMVQGIGGPSSGGKGQGGDINPDRNSQTNYMFERATGKVYIYNTTGGVQAIIPQSNFVNLPKK